MTYCPECGKKMTEAPRGGDAKPKGSTDRPRYRCHVDKVTWEWHEGSYTLVEGEIS